MTVTGIQNECFCKIEQNKVALLSQLKIPQALWIKDSVFHLRFRNWENNVDIHQVQRKRKCPKLKKKSTFLITGKSRERT